MIFVNFKTYQQGTGEAALNLAKICAEVERETGIQTIPVVQAVDIFRLANQGLIVWVQHIDEVSFGPNTGQILSEGVLAAGAQGILLNHSEKKLPLEKIKNILEGLKNLKNLICAESLDEGQQIASFKPDFLAYEPPELIGGQVSVSQSKPEIIREFVNQIKDVPILVGAGIHSQEDVKKALNLGVRGVLISSDVVLSNNPKQELLNLAGGFK